MGNIIDFKKYKKIKNKDNEDFMKALDRLSKQNGLNYVNLILGDANEKKIEREKYNKKMKLCREKIESMEN